MNNKHVYTTFNDETAQFFKDRGIKALVMYESDGIRCYKVTLRGRKQCRLLEDPDFTALHTKNAPADAAKIVAARLRPPVYAPTVDGQIAPSMGTDRVEVLPFCRNEQFLRDALTPPGGTLPPEVGTKKLESWAEVQGVLELAKKEQLKGIRIFLGYGYEGLLPYQETYPIDLPLQVAQHLAKNMPEADKVDTSAPTSEAAADTSSPPAPTTAQ